VFPNIKTSHRYEVVTSGGTRVNARGLNDRNPFTLTAVQQAAYARLQSSPDGGQYLTSRHGRFTQYPLNRRLGVPQRWSGNFCSRETSVAPTGIPASNRRTVHPAAQHSTCTDRAASAAGMYSC